MDNELGRKFKGRLKLDNQTGDLTISDISTTDTGSYKVTITSTTKTSITFSLTVKPADAVESISVIERDSVTLHTVTKIQRYDMIQWRFQNSPIAEINREAGIFNTSDGADGRFKHKLQLDCLSGSLTVNNIGTKHSGLYEVDIRSSKHTIHKTFSVTVSGEWISVSVMEGHSVTLNTDTELRRDDFMLWMVGDTVIAEISQTAQRFPTSEDSGLYELKISSSRHTILRRIIVTVTASVKKE
ncbi:uncharacterized protein [Sinocyclocheilus grahami]|uniref:uncharacterized protein n=1 Tax=Sinocyclocheilus grahami TaxID=75366 RepID=UPI0007ACD7DE|nr:PREDICTED: uncharacterized protein LOC107570776 [Sinocyclocheilus grahami]